MTGTLCSNCKRGYYVRAEAREEYYFCNNCYKTKLPDLLVEIDDEPTDRVTEIFAYIDEMFADADD